MSQKEKTKYHILMHIYSLVAQRLKHLPTMRETWVRSLGWEDPLEKEMATHSSILAWRIPWMEEPGGIQSTESQSVRHDWATSLHMKSRKMVLMNLLAGQQWRCRCKQKTCGHNGERRGWEEWKRVALKHIHYHI